MPTHKRRLFTITLIAIGLTLGVLAMQAVDPVLGQDLPTPTPEATPEIPLAEQAGRTDGILLLGFLQLLIILLPLIAIPYLWRQAKKNSTARSNE